MADGGAGGSDSVEKGLRGAVAAAEAAVTASLKSLAPSSSAAIVPRSSAESLEFVAKQAACLQRLARAAHAVDEVVAGAATGERPPPVSLRGLAAAGALAEVCCVVGIRAPCGAVVGRPVAAFPLSMAKALRLPTDDLKSLEATMHPKSSESRTLVAATAANLLTFLQVESAGGPLRPRLLPDCIAALLYLDHVVEGGADSHEAVGSGSGDGESEAGRTFSAARLEHRKGEAALVLDVISSDESGSGGMSVELVASSLLTLLFEGARRPRWFSSACGSALSKCLMRPRGVAAVVREIGSRGDSGEGGGGTKVVTRIANILSRAPAVDVCEPASYFAAVGPQLQALLRSQGDASARFQAHVAAASISIIAERTDSADTALRFVLVPLLRPLLRYAESEVGPSSAEVLGRPVVVSEASCKQCVEDLHRLVTMVPLAPSVAARLDSVIPALLDLYLFCHDGGAVFATTKRAVVEILHAWLKVAPSAPHTVVQAIQQRGMPLLSGRRRAEFAAGDSGGVVAVLTSAADRPGGVAGDIGLQLASLGVTLDGAGAAEDMLDPAILSALQSSSSTQDGDGMTALLKPLEKTRLPGDIFVALLRGYMSMRLQTVEHSSEELLRPKRSKPATVASAEPEVSIGVTFRIVQVLVALMEGVGSAVLSDAKQILDMLHSVLQSCALALALPLPTTHAVATEPTSRLADEDDAAEVVSTCMSLLSFVVDANSDPDDACRSRLLNFLPVLTAFGEHSDEDIRKSTSAVRLAVLTLRRGGALPSGGADGATVASELTEIRAELQDEHPAVQGGGLQRIAALVRRRIPEAEEHVGTLFDVALEKLSSEDSYVYLAAAASIATLVDVHAVQLMPRLIRAFSNPSGAVRERTKLGEALRAAAHRCGETLPRYARPLIGALMQAGVSMRKPSHAPAGRRADDRGEYLPRGERGAAGAGSDGDSGATGLSSDSVFVKDAGEVATFRASCLSNLGEVCRVLGAAVEPQLRDIIGGIAGILEWERGDPDAIVVRRGAAYVLAQLLEGAGPHAVTELSQHLPRLSATLSLVDGRDPDSIVRGHARHALAILEAATTVALTPSSVPVLRVGIRGARS